MGIETAINAEKAISEYDTLQKIVDQLRFCEYECVGGRLEQNVAFIALERMAKNERQVKHGEYRG